MTEDEMSPSEDAPAGAPETPTPTQTSPAFDFTGLRGFQSLERAAQESEEAYQVELVKELVARAERFVHAVDSSIVLASDGVIRWLGDPVARLVAGDELLKPRAVLLADEALPAENREGVERRLSLWVTAHIHKVLGPLQGLSATDGAPASVAEVALKVADALGVLNREDARKQVKALDQNARAALRKLGVRFGANYVFVPALLKPGARALCLQLWGLKHGAEPDSDKLISYAAAGRTSFPVDGVLSPTAYRIAGFRLCGERVVRVDIVERLTDLIRAAIPELMRQGAGGAPSAGGFVITQQMTSLTGCAGEAFASILRSLGFEAHQVKKSEYEATRRKPEPPKVEATAETVTEDSGEAASTPEPDETMDAEGLSAEAVATEVEAEAPAVVETEAPEPDAVGEMEAPTAEIHELAAAHEAAEPDSEAPAGEQPVDEALADAQEQPSEAAAEPLEDGPTEAAAADSAPLVPPEDPLIEVWRPAPRRQGPHHHHHRHKSLPPEGTGKIVWRAREPKPEPQRRATPQRQPEPAAVGPQEPAEAVAEGGQPTQPQRHGQGQGRGDRHGGGPPFKGPKRDERPQGDRPPRKEPRPPVVDPDSPFAKLAALRPLLERRDKRT
jgi:ATP-dependent RNA helicase SUPV3L1/SUV3